MSFRNSDVCVISFAKSGTQWCYEVVDMLRNNSLEYHDRMIPLIEMFPVEKLKLVPDGVFVSQLVPRHMPKDSMARKCKIINIYRNPKDVCVSLFTFIKKTKTGELMKDMELHHWTTYWGFLDRIYKRMDQFPGRKSNVPSFNSLLRRHEKGPYNTRKKIAEFLDLDRSEELISKIANKCEFKAMSVYKNNNIPASFSIVTDVKDKHIMYRKGEAGDWKNWLKVAQSEAVDAAVETAKIPLEIMYT